MWEDFFTQMVLGNVSEILVYMQISDGNFYFQGSISRVPATQEQPVNPAPIAKPRNTALTACKGTTATTLLTGAVSLTAVGAVAFGTAALAF